MASTASSLFTGKQPRARPVRRRRFTGLRHPNPLTFPPHLCTNQNAVDMATIDITNPDGNEPEAKAGLYVKRKEIVRYQGTT